MKKFEKIVILTSRPPRPDATEGFPDFISLFFSTDFLQLFGENLFSIFPSIKIYMQLGQGKNRLIRHQNQLGYIKTASGG